MIADQWYAVLESRDIVDRLAMPFNLRILRQDQAVVQSQLPKRSDMKIGGKLVQADHLIVAYRTRRHELMDAIAAQI
jgi:hypothetical protein